VKDWLKGYNIRDDGALVNHNIIHCDYMTTFSMKHAIVSDPVAGRPAGARRAPIFNAAVVYRSLVEQKWPSPPYKAPGGTMYVPGKVADVFTPTEGPTGASTCSTSSTGSTRTRTSSAGTRC